MLDGMAGLWNVNIGYGNEELPLVAAEQMRKLAFTSNFVGMTNLPSAELADRLAGIAHPTLNTTFFTSGGSESNDSAFKTARYYWYRLGKKEKVKFISRQYAYHGITLAATAATGIPRYHTMFGPIMPGFIHIPNPYPYRYEGDIRPGESIGQAAARALEECIVREGPETVAAFIAEPIQGAGGVIVPPDDYFPLVQAICDQVRCAADRRRGDHRLRAHGQNVWPAPLGPAPGHYVLRQGHHQRLHAAGRHPDFRRDPRGHRHGRAPGHVDARLHLLGPRGGLRRGVEEPGDHRAGAPGGERGDRWASGCRAA